MVDIKIHDIKLVPISEITRNPKNRNKHPEDQIKELARHYGVHGMRTPIIVSNQSGFIVAGDGRFQAALEAKMSHVPVSYQDFETPESEFAFGVADNGLSLWSELDLAGINADALELPDDFNFMDLGIKDFVLTPTEMLNPQCDEDEAPESVQPKTKVGDIYQLGRHRLICGDSLSVTTMDALMNGEKADMIWTDPPYNVAVQGGNRGNPDRTDGLKIENDSMDDELFYKFLYDAYVTMLTAVKPGGAIYVAHADSEGINFRKALKDSGFLLKQCLIWAKNTFVMGRQDYHWKHKPILYGWAPGASHNWYSDRKQSTLFHCNKPQRNGEHPTMKPVELVEYFLGNSCAPGGLILDSFGGSGQP